MKPVAIFLLSCLLPVAAVCADIVNGSVWLGDKYARSDLVIGTDVMYAPDTLFVTETILLENNGELKTDIYLCDRCDLFVKNRGVIDSNFYLGEYARLFQVVSGNADMVSGGFMVPYSVMIDGVDDLSLAHVIDFANMADEIILKNSVLDINGVTSGIEVPITIEGDVIFKIDDLGDLYDVVFMKNVSGSGTVRVLSDNADRLFSDVAYIRDGNLIFTRVRETDYSKIFGDELGAFLDSLRMRDSEDDLINALDAANDMNELHRVMTKSARLNPDVLLNIIRVVGVIFRDDYMRNGGVLLNPFMGWSNDFYVWGLNLGYVVNVDENFRLGIVGHVGDIEFKSDVDVFSGVIYGVGFMAEYTFENNLFVRGGLDVLRYVFDIDCALYENNIVTGPVGIGLNLESSVGYKFKVADSFWSVPFVGVGADYTDVEKYQAQRNYGVVGMDIRYDYDMLGIKYNYGIGINVNTNSELEFMGCVGFWGDMDGVGGDFSASVVSMADITSYRISVNARAIF